MEFDPTKGIREAREEEERRSKVIKPRMLGDDHEYKVSTSTGTVSGASWCWLALLSRSRLGPGFGAVSVPSSSPAHHRALVSDCRGFRSTR